jgi:hypothetical protein
MVDHSSHIVQEDLGSGISIRMVDIWLIYKIYIYKCSTPT